jgi:D-3-phosphoglycerate dehydrogenase
MADTVVDDLIVDLLRWLASGQKSYVEVMEAWRTSCPKLPVWEDANDRGFISIETEPPEGRRVVKIAPEGIAFLEQAARARNSDLAAQKP